MTKTTNPLAAALENVAAQAAIATSWAAELDAAKAAQRDAEARRPQTPAESQDVAQRRIAARERVAVARDALETARVCELGARRAAVGAEADNMVGAIRDAHKALSAYREKLADLLARLAEHTGRTNWGHTVGPREADLVEAVQRLERARDLLRAAASGESLDATVAELPASLQADGVCPDPRALDAAEDDRQRRADAAAWDDHLAALQSEVDGVVEMLGIDAPAVLTTEREYVWAQVSAQEWRDRANAASDVGQAPPAQFDVLARLCGPYAAERAVTQWRTQGAAPEAASAAAAAS